MQAVITPPTATDDTASVTAGETANVAVLTNDSAGTHPLDTSSVTVTAAPANGSVTVNPDGTIDYKPNVGYSGTDTFTYQVCDNAPTPNCVTANVTMNVGAITPTAVDDTASVTAGETAKVSVTANEYAGTYSLDASSVSVTAQPSNGSVTVNADGKIDYTPRAGFVGEDNFSYQVCDTLLTPNCVTAMVIVTVIAPSTNPTPVPTLSLYGLLVLFGLMVTTVHHRHRSRHRICS